MEIILLEKVENLGNLGDIVNVKAGYGRNYLIPHGKATAATADNKAQFEARRAELEQRAAKTRADAEERRAKLTELVVTIPARAGSEGRLFGSVGPADIAEAVSAAGIDLKKHELRLHEGPLRTLGEHDVEVRLHSDVFSHIKVNIVVE